MAAPYVIDGNLYDIDAEPGTPEFKQIESAIKNRNVANIRGRETEQQQSSHMGKPQQMHIPDVSSKRALKAGGEWHATDLGASDDEMRQEKNRIEGIHQQALDTHPLQNYLISVGKTSDALKTGMANMLPDSIGGDPEENLAKHEEGFEPYSYLRKTNPAISFGGEITPYMFPWGKVAGRAMQGLGRIPAVTKAVNNSRRVVSAPFDLAKLSVQYPSLQQGIAGAGWGAVDPYDSALSGFIAASGLSIAGGKLTNKLVQPQSGSARTSMHKEVIKSAKRSGYNPDIGTIYSNKTQQMKIQGYKNYEGITDIFDEAVKEHDQTTARIIIQDIFGETGDELSGANINKILKNASEGVQESVDGLRGNGDIIRNVLDDVDDVVVGGTVDAIYKDSDLSVYSALSQEISDMVGNGYLTGAKFQRIDQAMRTAKNAAKRGSALENRIIDLQKGVNDAIENIVPADKLSSYKLAKEKYAVAKKVQKHTESGQLNFNALADDLKSFDNYKWANELPPADSPMGKLHRIALYDQATKGKGASLQVSQDLGRELEKAPMWGEAKAKANVRGNNIQGYNNPFSFRSNQHFFGRLGSADSEQTPIVPATYALNKVKEGANSDLGQKLFNKWSSMVDSTPILSDFSQGIRKSLLDNMLDEYFPNEEK